MDAARTSDNNGMWITPTLAAESEAPGTEIRPEEKSCTARDYGSGDAADTASHRRKPLSFYMAFLCLLIMVFVCSADSTIMSVSIPVSQTHLEHLNLKTTQKLTSTDHHQRVGRHYL